MTETPTLVQPVPPVAPRAPEATAPAYVTSAAAEPAHPVPATAPAEAPRVEPRAEAVAPAPAPQAPRPEFSPVELKEYLSSTGLVMVETDRSKVPTPAAPAAETEALGRPRRERTSAPTEEELVQVETRSK